MYLIPCNCENEVVFFLLVEAFISSDPPLFYRDNIAQRLSAVYYACFRSASRNTESLDPCETV